MQPQVLPRHWFCIPQVQHTDAIGVVLLQDGKQELALAERELREERRASQVGGEMPMAKGSPSQEVAERGKGQGVLHATKWEMDQGQGRTLGVGACQVGCGWAHGPRGMCGQPTSWSWYVERGQAATEQRRRLSMQCKELGWHATQGRCGEHGIYIGLVWIPISE